MGTFDDRATRPARGPADMVKWKVLRRSDPRPANFAELDAIRPRLCGGGAAALASGEPVAVWIGHATWALRLGVNRSPHPGAAGEAASGKLIVTDPVWSTSLSGVVKRLVQPGVALDEMPAIDIVLVTHDHRDHMDLPTLEKLGDAPLYIVPLGNGPRIKHPNVVELDWWQTHEVGDLAITLVPARHWSMREPWNKNDTLWGGYVIKAPEGVAYHSGDTAFGEHFADIAQRMGPIDWAMLPIGGYNPRWFMESQHVDPVEAARGFEALGAKHMLAMHWGTFRLTDEAVGEPPEMLRAYWREHQLADERLWILDVGEARRLR
jgi:L-ascorbate metabolism protein UlaG (beta-lactamase superfamily)